jgi:hypothetical protein
MELSPDDFPLVVLISSRSQETHLYGVFSEHRRDGSLSKLTIHRLNLE